MLQIIDDVYREPPTSPSVKAEALIIHRRTKEQPGTHLGVFVHGLGGERYGPSATWGKLPSLLFEDFPNLDVGMYRYSTLLRRLIFWKSVSIGKEASVLGDLLLTLGGYKHLILFGHSLGGTLCKSVLEYLYETERHDTLNSVSGLYLLATPQLGSGRVPGIIAGLTDDFQALRRNGPFLEQLTLKFQQHFHCSQSYPLQEDKVHIPCWALVASEDFWVDGLSAGITLDQSQVRTVRASHTSVVKPDNKDDDSYRHLLSFMKQTVQQIKGDKHYECSPAREGDLRLIHELATSLFGDEVSSLDLMRSWWERNHDVFWLLRRVTRGVGRRIEEIAGYFCLLPIDLETAAQIAKGSLRGFSLDPQLVSDKTAPTEALYIGGIVGIDPRAKVQIMTSFTTRVYSMKRRDGRVLVLTRPVTKDGLRTARQWEMDPVDPLHGDLGQIYSFYLPCGE
jgi:hypothetical protein